MSPLVLEKKIFEHFKAFLPDFHKIQYGGQSVQPIITLFANLKEIIDVTLLVKFQVTLFSGSGEEDF